MAGWFDIVTTSDGLTIVTTTYTIGDCLDNVHTFANAGIAAGGSGMIHGAVLADKGDVMGPAILHLYNATITVTDNAAFAPADADTLNKIAEIWFPPLRDEGANRDAYVQLQVPYVCAGGATSLFGVLETRSANAVFVATTDIQMRLTVWRDA